MKKIAVIALSLGLLGALPAAQAATVSVDAGTYVFSYDDSFLTGSIFSSGSNVFTFSGLSYQASATGGGAENGLAVGSFNGYNGQPYPIVITPKAGYQIIGVTESVYGGYAATASADADGAAGVSAGLVSRWVLLNGVYPLGQNTPYQIGGVVSGDPSVSSTYKASGSLDFTPAITADGLVPGPVVLASLDLLVAAGAHGNGSAAIGTLNQYQIGVQTAAVPEPEALALMLAGLGLVGFKLARRKN